jgi:hypothetical protein
MNKHARRRGHTAAVVGRVEQSRTVSGSLNTVGMGAGFGGGTHADTRGGGSRYGNGVGIGRGGHILCRGGKRSQGSSVNLTVKVPLEVPHLHV